MSRQNYSAKPNRSGSSLVSDDGFISAIRDEAAIYRRKAGVPMTIAQKQKLSVQMRKRKVTLPTVKWTEQT